MSPSEVSRLLEMVQEVRDSGIRTEEQIAHIREKLEKGADRMDDHSDKFPKMVKRLEDLEGINLRTGIESLPDRIKNLEGVNIAADKTWAWVTAPVKATGALLLILIVTALWNWLEARYSFFTPKPQPAAVAP